MTTLGPPRLGVAPPATNVGLLTTASATGNPRNKVALKPGRSLLDWIRLGKNSADLSGVGGVPRDVSAAELAKHCSVDDAWTALKGKVYNITSYMEFHPGGVPELMRAAGVDCSSLFDEVHRWVNYESMLAKCYVGDFIPATETLPSRQDVPNAVISADETDAVKSTSSAPRYDWFQTDSTVTLAIYTRCDHVTHHNVIAELVDQHDLSVSVFVNDYVFNVRRHLENNVSTDYRIAVSSTGKVDIVFKKVSVGTRWSSFGSTLPNDGAWEKTIKENIKYWSCAVESIETVTHDINLYCFRFPPGNRMSVPVGRHVFVTARVDDADIVQSYTVVPPSLLGDHVMEAKVKDGHSICLMIKIYPNGLLTPSIGRLQLGDTFQISRSYDGDFDVKRLDTVRRCILIAAGTGFTPMAAILRHCYTDITNTNQRPQVTLVDFNKTEEDIPWKKELDLLAATVDWFRIDYVLSEPGDHWHGPTGFIRQELVEKYAGRHQADSEASLVCCCGPLPFTQLTIRLVQELGFTDDMIHAFMG